MMGTEVKAFAPLCNRSLEDLVPAGNFYRHLEGELDLDFVRGPVRDTYKERGRPSVDPTVFFKLQLVLFIWGIRSERELVRIAADRLSVRWYLGYDLDEELPDHSSLTNSMGIPAQFEHPRYLEAVKRVVAACNAHGKAAGIMAGSVADAQLSISQGFRAIAYSGDLWIYQQGLRDGLAAIRAHATQ